MTTTPCAANEYTRYRPFTAPSFAVISGIQVQYTQQGREKQVVEAARDDLMAILLYIRRPSCL
jgi:hypothetical protein